MKLKKIMCDKRGKKMGAGSIFGITAGVIVILFLVVGLVQQTAKPVTKPTENGVDLGVLATCPSDGDWSGTISAQNGLNATGSETYDNTANFYVVTNDLVNSDGTVNGGYENQITDTTSGSVTLSCGSRYAMQFLSVDGNAGDSSRIIDIISSSGVSDAKIVDGVLFFTAKGSRGAITVEGEQFGLPEVRVKDVLNDGFMYDTSDISATDYESTDGANFTSTTDNSTSTAVGTGGEYHVKLYVRTANDDNDFNDRGVYYLVDANTDTWEEPSVELDGVSASESSSLLSADETISYNAYEYVYFIPETRNLLNKDEIAIDLDIFASSGTDPTTGIATDLAGIGLYASSSNGDVLKKGAVDDSSSRSQVYTLHDIDLAIS